MEQKVLKLNRFHFVDLIHFRNNMVVGLSVMDLMVGDGSHRVEFRN